MRPDTAFRRDFQAVRLALLTCRAQPRALSITPPELAKLLGKTESDIHLALEELQRQGVGVLGDGIIQISPRFWPYQRDSDPATSDESRPYVEQVKPFFLQRRCVQSSFTAADEKLARSLYGRGVSP